MKVRGSPTRVRVRTPSRLHFGIIDLGGSMGRRCGAVGLAIDEPKYEILAEGSDELEILGPQEDIPRIEDIVRRLARTYGFSECAKISVPEALPQHVGLGSTTQLTLGIGASVAALNRTEVSPIELAKRMGRGRNSGIGTYAFAYGGFIVDGGARGDGFPPLIARYDFPEEWRFVVIIPGIERGLDEESERELFERATAPPDIPRGICHLLVMKMLPALVERDIETFGQALNEMEELVGMAFSIYQKGKFRHKAIADLVAYMLEGGAAGAGQSSWGPAVYGLVESDASAGRLERDVRKFLQDEGYQGLTFVTRPKNSGAKVEVISRAQ